MIDVVMCMRRHPGMTPEQFRRYWRNDHAARVQEHAALLGVRHYVQLHTMEVGVEPVVREMRGCPEDAYDGIAILTWDSFEDMVAKGAVEEALAASQELLEDEKQFLDLPRCLIWFAEPHEIVV